MKEVFKKDLERYFDEDDAFKNLFYLQKLPSDPVCCSLKIKDDVLLAGLPYFVAAFNYLQADLDWHQFSSYEGKEFRKSENKIINFNLPFNIALTGERVALNLLQRATSIATLTTKFVQKAKDKNIAILDTRKTTPGLRTLEKYATRVGGAYNHRLSQTDLWMVKDNHKSFFGGLKQAVEFFQDMQGFYTPIEVEIHNLDELKEAIDCGVRHVMLDNFTPELVKKALAVKPTDMTFELSGGITLESIDKFLISGVDAVSVGSITHSALNVDLSLKYERV